MQLGGQLGKDKLGDFVLGKIDDSTPAIRVMKGTVTTSSKWDASLRIAPAWRGTIKA